jgi:hypothetical protein
MTSLFKTPAVADLPFKVTLRRVFTGEQGIRAGWSVLIFAAIFLILLTSMIRALGHFVAVYENRPIPLRVGILAESSFVLAVLLATWVMARIEKHPLLCYGYRAGIECSGC